MSQVNKIALIKEMLASAEASIRSAKQMLADLPGGDVATKINHAEMANMVGATAEGKIIEGVFTGEKMIDGEGKEYSVPSNYASKSKLVEGDILKLTITDDGRFLYKQIGPIPRKTIIGPLTYEDGKYKVIAEGKAYNILLASITFYHAEIGDNVAILVPELQEANWGAVDNVLPREISIDEFNEEEVLE